MSHTSHWCVLAMISAGLCVFAAPVIAQTDALELDEGEEREISTAEVVEEEDTDGQTRSTSPFGGFIPRSSEIQEQPLSIQYNSMGHWKSDVSRQRSRFGMYDHDLRLAIPIAQDDVDQWIFRTRVRILDIETDARLPDTRDVFPGELYDIGIGATYTRKLTNGWLAGGDVRVSSPSDKPFASAEEIAVNATVFTRIPDGTDAWHFYINFANDRDFANYIPLPGVGYEFSTDFNLRGIIGVPYTRLTYQPMNWLELRAQYIIPRNVDTELAFLTDDFGEFYGGYEWARSQFFRHDRRDDDGQLTYYEMRVKGGWRYEWQQIALELEGGYAFDRFWYEGEDYDDRGENRFNLEDTPYLMLQVRLSF